QEALQVGNSATRIPGVVRRLELNVETVERRVCLDEEPDAVEGRAGRPVFRAAERKVDPDAQRLAAGSRLCRRGARRAGGQDGGRAGGYPTSHRHKRMTAAPPFRLLRILSIPLKPLQPVIGARL